MITRAILRVVTGVRRTPPMAAHALSRNVIGKCLWALGIVIGWLAAGVGPTAAQQPAVKNNDKRPFAIIKEVRPTTEPIILRVNRSTIVELRDPVREVRLASVEPAEVTVVSPRRLLLTGRQAGSTQLLVTPVDGEEQVFDVFVELDLARLDAAIRKIAPTAQFEVNSVQNSVVISGRVPDAETAERVMDVAELFSANPRDHLVVGGVQQVMVRVTFAEVARSATRSLGVSGYGFGSDFFWSFVPEGTGTPVQYGLPAGTPVTANTWNRYMDPIRANRPITAQQGGFQPYLIGATGGPGNVVIGIPQFQIQAYIQALRDNQLARILAEPTVVAMSGQQSSFLAGGSYPVPVPQAGTTGGAVITIQYQPYGVQLNFRPTVLGGQMIRLEINPIVSDLDYANGITIAGFTVPGLIQRQVNTVVELGNGQTLGIAGLLNQNIAASASGLPGLGDLPVVGALFSSTRYQKRETELLILITPELVEAMQPNEVRNVPGQFMTDPNDWQLWGLKMLEGEPRRQGVPSDAPNLSGTTPINSASPSSTAGGAGKTVSTKQIINLKGPWGPTSLGDETPQ